MYEKNAKPKGHDKYSQRDVEKKEKED